MSATFTTILYAKGAGMCHDTTKNEDEAIIDKIQEIRARNNIQWMALVRLAMKHAPEDAKLLLQAISENDACINELTRKLAGRE